MDWVHRLARAIRAHLEYETGYPKGSHPRMLQPDYDRELEMRAALEEYEEVMARGEEHLVFVEEARRYVWRNIAKGVDCPACQKYCKLVKRSLNKFMAEFILGLLHRSRSTGKRWHTSRQCLPKSGQKSSTDGTYLQHWKLVERHPDNSRRWRLTKLGYEFALGRLEVSPAVYTFNRGEYGFQEEGWVNIRQALGTDFDYNDLVNGNHYERLEAAWREAGEEDLGDPEGFANELYDQDFPEDEDLELPEDAGGPLEAPTADDAKPPSGAADDVHAAPADPAPPTNTGQVDEGEISDDLFDMPPRPKKKAPSKKKKVKTKKKAPSSKKKAPSNAEPR